MAQFEKALLEINYAQKLDPLSMIIYHLSVVTHCFLGKYDDAISQCQKAMEIDPNFGVVHFSAGLMHSWNKRYSEAIEAYRKAIKLSGGFYWVEGALGYAYGKLNEKDKCEEMLHRLKKLSEEKYVSSVCMALINIGINQRGKTLDYLEKAYEERDPLIIFLNIFPEWEPLHFDPRFKALIKKLGLQNIKMDSK
jgi:tetratricopeptide (TPR) repeat protein